MSLLNIVIPFDSNLHSIKHLNDTINSIPKSKDINTIVVSTNDLDQNINYIKVDFKNIFSAYNIATSTIKEGYVLYIVPGDMISLNESRLLSLINKDYNIIQFNHNRKKPDGSIYHLSKLDTKDRIIDGNKNIPNNMGCVYDKLYKVSFLKENKIKFNNHINTSLIFNYTCLDKSNFLFINLIAITHLIGCDTGILDNTESKENKLIKGLLSSEKTIIAKNISEKYKRNQDSIYYSHIDFVFPYVTSDDPAWQQLYKAALTGTETDWSAGIERFRDNGMLKYLFRSLEKNMPWINQVHMIVMSDSQVPSWLDRSKVDIIYHNEFLPNNLLPTFNSSTIETFLPLLPRVSNTFIYSNDDLIPFKALSPEFFFNYGKPIYSIQLGDFRPTAPGDVLRRKDYNLIMNTNENRIVITQHGPLVYKKAWIKECYNKYEDILIKSCSKFREDQNYNQYLYAFYQMMKKNIINSEKKIKSYIARTNKISTIIAEDFKKNDFVCINDDNNTSKQDWDKIISKIDAIFPNKSKYEK